jgi:hypothetical protein
MIAMLLSGSCSSAPARRSLAVGAIAAVVVSSMSTVSAHVVRGILFPTQATAFVSSPSAAEDAPIPIRWGTDDSGLRVACFNVANTAPPLPDAPGYPRVTAVGFELPGVRGGFSLLTVSPDDWRVVSNAPASLLGRGSVTLDLVLLARGAGLPPGQPAARGSGTRFCLSGPFPEGVNIEQLINGVVVGFQKQADGPIVDIGVWDNPQRMVPLFP